MEVNGTAAVVTGAGSGLGAEVAAHLARSGAKVGLIDINADNARAQAGKIGGVAAECDVTDPDQAAAALDRIAAENGTARILVNCAGIGGAKRIVGRSGPMPQEDFERIVRVNLFGSFNMMRLAADAMSRLDPLEDGERGVIVSTASVAAYEGQIGQAAYAASKGGIVSLTLPAARELASFGIRVLTIAPGIFLTPLLYELPEEAQESLGKSIPFPQRLGKPEEFAELVETCVTNRALNGETIRLDGAVRLAPR